MLWLACWPFAARYRRDHSIFWVLSLPCCTACDNPAPRGHCMTHLYSCFNGHSSGLPGLADHSLKVYKNTFGVNGAVVLQAVLYTRSRVSDHWWQQCQYISHHVISNSTCATSQTMKTSICCRNINKCSWITHRLNEMLLLSNYY